jgi:hypothetical protein
MAMKKRSKHEVRKRKATFVVRLELAEQVSHQAIVGVVKRSVAQWGGYQGLVIAANPLSLYASGQSTSVLRGIVNDLASELQGHQRNITVADWNGVAPAKPVSVIYPLVKACFVIPA